MQDLVTYRSSDLQKSFKNGVLKACDKLCEKKTLRKEGNTWWGNVEVKDAIARKKESIQDTAQEPT